MKTLDRNEAVQLLREKCMALVDDDHSICEVAARLKIFCGGFAQWTFAELKDRYDWIVARHPHITRKELEELANRWQLARQFVSGTALACDNQRCESFHRTCRGWDEFSDEDLARFVAELTGDEVSVVEAH